MSTWFATRPLLTLLIGLTVGLLAGIGMVIGTLATTDRSRGATRQMPETLLHATASHGSESLIMATGWMDTDVEGLFTLDCLTGDLQCCVVNPQVASFGAVFKYNVIGDLGAVQGKKPNYVMVTGQASFTQGTALAAPARSVVYVADANTGRFAAYSLMWNRTMFRSNTQPAGGFALLGTGTARVLPIR
ncbi:MAG: hypothetical protein H8E44_22145 [Planctomycetes bacterium]|nr:hypothetical protein [Planctomycetota bacterium]